MRKRKKWGGDEEFSHELPLPLKERIPRIGFELSTT